MYILKRTTKVAIFKYKEYKKSKKMFLLFWVRKVGHILKVSYIFIL